jgi:hypothetical protein
MCGNIYLATLKAKLLKLPSLYYNVEVVPPNIKLKPCGRADNSST